MNEPRIVSAAESDYTDALCWYAERSRRAAEGFDAEFERALKMICADPRRFPMIDDRHRFYLMDRYPYQIVYREDGDQVTVIAVAHAKRRPKYWANR